MNEHLQRPDFSRFRLTSVARRQRLNAGFLAICIVTSALSIVVLIVLLTSILVSALPVFGRHADRHEAETRVRIVQGNNEGNDLQIVDAGDLIQGVFQVEKVSRGGLGSSNDQKLRNPQNPDESAARLGIFSLQVEKKLGDHLYSLGPAQTTNGLRSILESIGLQADPTQDLSCATIAILETDSAPEDYAFSQLTIENQLVSDNKLASKIDANHWQLHSIVGTKKDSDFVELLFSAANQNPVDEISSIQRTRARKNAGRLKAIQSILVSRSLVEFKPIRLRPYSKDQLVSGDFKIDTATLTGLSRRQKNGFDLGGKWELVASPVSKDSPSAAAHLGHFLKETPKSDPAQAGIGPALMGSVWVIIACGLAALPLGIATAIFLEEFKTRQKHLSMLQSLIQLNISNLAGVPSIVYGLLGLTAFVTMFGLFGAHNDPVLSFGAKHYHQYLTEGLKPVLIPIKSLDEVPILTDGMAALDSDYKPITLKVLAEGAEYPDDQASLAYTLRHDAEGGAISNKSWFYFQIPFGRGVLAASLTLMLVILPVIIISSQEALRSVPSSLREGALGLGLTPWQVVRRVTLPAAVPSIMTGAILSISRAIGEAAPILVICGIVYIGSSPKHLMDTFSVLPISIFYGAGLPVDEQALINSQNVSAAAILVLLAALLSFNAVAILLRQWTQKPLT